MSPSAEISLKWGDGTYTFALKLPQIQELQRRSNAGIGVIAKRLLVGEPYVEDIVWAIQLGLVGGGTPPTRVSQLMELYVEGQPLAAPNDPSSPLATAIAIIGAVWQGLDTLERDDASKDTDGLVDVEWIRGQCAKMGWGPSEIRSMSLYEFLATAQAHNNAVDDKEGGPKVAPPSDASFDEMLDQLRAMKAKDVEV